MSKFVEAFGSHVVGSDGQLLQDVVGDVASINIRLDTVTDWVNVGVVYVGSTLTYWYPLLGISVRPNGTLKIEVDDSLYSRKQ